MSGISGVAATTPEQVNANRGRGLEAMTGQDFLKLLISQLTNQDPMEPMKNDELMRQLSAIRELESNNEISTNFKNLLAHQELSSASVLVGKMILGVSADGNLVEGIAERIIMDKSGIRLQVGGYELALGSVMAVENVPTGNTPDPENSTETGLLGDIDGDGDVTDADKELLLARLDGQDAPGEFALYDLNGDGKVDQTDLDLMETLLLSGA